MFRNIGKKEDYKEAVIFQNGHYIISWDKQLIMITDYEPEPDPLPEDYEPVPIGEHEDPIFCSWMQEIFIKKPDIQQIKNIILNNINESIDKKILNGFSWDNGKGTIINVYLSSENQFNYKAAYDLAYQTNGESLPFVLKFGEIDNPQYYSFNTLEEFSDFYLKCIEFINNTLKEGWEKKDSIDWSKYDIN